MRSLFLPALAFCLLLALPGFADDLRPQPENTTAIAGRASVPASHMMVVTANPLATKVGLDVLAAGGSAADAAIAVQAMLGLVEPQSSGLGGGAFALYWDAALGELTSFDARETAPLAAGEDYWLGPDGQPVAFPKAVVGGRSVGVPGTPLLLQVLHSNYGRLPWADLLRPAIEAADRGFEVSDRLAASIAEAADRGLTAFAPARAYFFDEEGKPRAAGSRLPNPELAATLRLFADKGAAPFYTGQIARDIVAAVRTPDNPGLLTMADFADYGVRERTPVCAPYRSYKVCGMGPPSSGALTVGQILGLVSGFDLPTMGDGVAARHLLAEAGRLAFADRDMYMADSDFVPMPHGLLDPAYLAERARLIDPARAMRPAVAGAPPADMVIGFAPDSDRPRHGTSHFVIVDAWGSMISMTSTIETGFGSRLMVGGFVLNNELTDFSFVPQKDGKPVANRVEGGKRPRSSMAPTIVFQNDRPVLLTGSPGGANIIFYTALSIVAALDWNMDLQKALDLPHVINRNGKTYVENGAQALADGLAVLGHEVEMTDLNSGLSAIRIAPDGMTGAADKRREGLAMGR